MTHLILPFLLWLLEQVLHSMRTPHFRDAICIIVILDLYIYCNIIDIADFMNYFLVLNKLKYCNILSAGGKISREKVLFKIYIAKQNYWLD